MNNLVSRSKSAFLQRQASLELSAFCSGQALHLKNDCCALELLHVADALCRAEKRPRNKKDFKSSARPINMPYTWHYLKKK